MCDPITTVADVAATVTGQEWAIPLINAGVAGAEGKGLKGAALAGGEALLGQEVGAAFGLGEGNSAVNSALGITWDNPASLGLPDIGGGINDAFHSAENSLGITGPTGTSGAPVDTTNSMGSTVSPSGSVIAPPPVSASVAPASGGGPIGSGALSDFDTKAIEQQLSGSFGGSSGAAANSAIGAAGTDAVGSNSGTFGFNLGGGATSAVGAGAPSTATSSGGGMSAWLPSKSDVGGMLMKEALPAAGLAYSALKGPSSLPPQASNLASGGAATAPLLALEQQGATEATTGQLTAPQQATVTQYIQDQQNQLLQQLSSQGVQNPSQDSRYIAGLRDIQERAMALQQQYIAAAVQQAISAGGAASNNIAAVANEQIQLDTDFQNSLAAAFAALGGGAGININKPAA